MPSVSTTDMLPNRDPQKNLNGFLSGDLSDVQQGAVIVSPSPSSAFRKHGTYNFTFETSELQKEVSENRSPSSSLLGTDFSDSDSEESELFRRLSVCPSDEIENRSIPQVEVKIAEDGAEVSLITNRIVSPKAPTAKIKPVRKIPPTSACDMYTPFKDAAEGVAQMISCTEPDHTTPKKTNSGTLSEKESPFPQGCCCRVFLESPEYFLTPSTMETSISSLLGTRGLWFDGWHAWSLYFDENGNKLPVPDDANQPEHLRRALQNRAYSMNARAQRIRQLHEDMAPFSSVRINSLRNEFHAFKRTASCGEDTFSRTTTPVSEVSESAVSIERLLESVKTCGDTNTTDFEPISQDEDLCYDSDPGEMNLQSNSCIRSLAYESKPPSNPALSGPSLMQQISSQTKFISDFMNTTITLVWHPPTDNNKRQAPQCVTAWIELGQQLRKTIIQPKFMWRRNQPLGRKVAISNDNLNGLDLLDIARVLEVNKISRATHPFARKSCSFYIETLEESFLFEASSEAEKSHIVHALKLIVARLGSKIILNDNTVFDEFFSNTFFSVPGKDPLKENLSNFS